MTREEMIAYCLETTNAERKRRGFSNMVTRELFDYLDDDELKRWTDRLKAHPRDANGFMTATWKL